MYISINMYLLISTSASNDKRFIVGMYSTQSLPLSESTFMFGCYFNLFSRLGEIGYTFYWDCFYSAKPQTFVVLIGIYPFFQVWG